MRMMRGFVYFLLALAAALTGFALTTGPSWLLWPASVSLGFGLLGVRDMTQIRHSVMRNYPIFSHMRWIFEGLRPEFRQYFFESDLSGTPFNREQRSLVYQRAKNQEDNKPFGTEKDVYESHYSWVNHSASPRPVQQKQFRVMVGGKSCKAPYSLSVFNVSAMSFGSLSGNAIEALNKGAKEGGFAHDTGEGSISRYHRKHGGDLIWEIGSGYFGCRRDDGSFDPDMYASQAASDQVKMIEIKLSQGAKPGHGGVLPGSKVSEEIAEARHVPVGQDCISPARHSAFSTPVELMQFIDRLRELSGGKPVGFKLCVGHYWEFAAMVKAMLKTGICPDFIVVDGSEGGTGAAPLEFSNHMGTPLREGLFFVHNLVYGAGLREQIKLGASGKIVSAFDMVRNMAIGADWCNSARGFMFSIGCIQSQVCHTNRCPVGVATQDKNRSQALVVEDKWRRVANFHRNTMCALAEFVAASGFDHPKDLRPWHFYRRVGSAYTKPGHLLHEFLDRGEILAGTVKEPWATAWALADPDQFRPQEIHHRELCPPQAGVN
ncbi:MAG: FMN-binding glutamate synthase family protein [Gammaproteobacteria bacterium]|nr:FMN-binding glutamate synthase family protein [Gammaproteobacteria bacterium]